MQVELFPVVPENYVPTVRGGGKVGHWSGGLVPLRAPFCFSDRRWSADIEYDIADHFAALAEFMGRGDVT